MPTTPVFLAIDFKRLEPPLDLGIINAPGCRWYVNNRIMLTNVTGSTGNATLNLAIPQSTQPGARLFFQYFPLDPGANGAGLTASNYGRVLSGN